MANLSIRKLDPNIYMGLRLRAAKHGISMEEEARRILSQAITSPENLNSVFQKHFGIDNGIDLDLFNQRTPHNPMDFNE